MEQKQRPDMDTDMEHKNNEKKLFAFNSFTGLVQLILTAILIFLCIPIFINKLGTEKYGVFCIVSVIGNLAIFANLSLDMALIKFLSEQGKCKESDRDIATMVILMSSILIPLSILIILFKEFILVHIFDIPAIYLEESGYLLVYLVIANFILLLGKTFTSIIESKQKIYLTNFAMFIYSCIYWGGIIILLYNGYGLKELGATILLAAFVWFLIVSIVALNNWGKLNLSGFRQGFKRSMKKQLSYSSKIYTGSLINFMYEPLTKILISNFINVSAVGIYEIALRLKNQIFSIYMKVLLPLYPALAIISDINKITIILKKTVTWLFYSIIPAFVLLIFCTEPIITLWIGGDDIALISLSTIVLVGVSMLFSFTSIPIYFFLRTKNHPEKEIYIQLINALINVIVIMALYQKFGYISVLVSYALSIFSSFVLCIYFQKKYLNIIPFSELNEKLKYFFSICFIAAVGFIYSFFFRENSLFYIISVTIIVGSVSIILFYRLKVFNKEDLSFK